MGLREFAVNVLRQRLAGGGQALYELDVAVLSFEMKRLVES